MKRYTHLSEEERTLIGHYYDNGLSIGAIGRTLGSDKSTISREIRRNKNKFDYNPQTAKGRYLSRRQRPCRLEKIDSLRTYVIDRLHEGFSPETIALRLKAFGYLEELPTISHEAIYQ